MSIPLHHLTGNYTLLHRFQVRFSVSKRMVSSAYGETARRSGRQVCQDLPACQSLTANPKAEEDAEADREAHA